MKKLFFILALSVLLFSALVSAQLSNPQLYWKFNETNNTNVGIDTVGLANLTTNTTFTYRDIGKLGNALRVQPATTLGFNTSAGLTSMAFGLGNFTIVYWFNASSTGAGYNVFSRGGTSATNWGTGTTSGGNLTFNVNSATVVTTGANITTRTYNRIVWVREGTGANKFRVYVNGVNTQNATLTNDFSDTTTPLSGDGANGASDGYNLDDARIYNNYAWTKADVIADYNGGVGQEIIVNTIGLTLNSPPANATLFDSSFLFNATSTNSGQLKNVTNITTYIYYANNSIFQIQSNLTPVMNNTLWNITGFTVNNYMWFGYACGRNSTNAVICFADAEGNRSFSWGSSLVDSFPNPVIESSLNTYYLNATVGVGQSIISANLNYNNTLYTGAISQINTTLFQITASVNAPVVTGDSSLLLFWNVTFSGGFNTVTTTRNQSVLNIGLDNCAVNTDLLINYSMFDEDTLLPLTGQTSNVTVETYVTLTPFGSITPSATFNRTYNVVNSSNTAKVCIASGILNSSTFSVDITTNYVAYLHSPESYNAQNLTVNSTIAPLLINLYDLLTTNAQQFKIIYRDRNYNPVANAVIDMRRRYVGLGQGVGQGFTVEAPETGSDGVTVGNFVLNDVVYDIYVTKNGQLLSTFTDRRATCEDVASGNCVISLLDRNSNTQISTMTLFNGVNFDNTIDKNNRQFTTAFITSTGINTVGSINITLLSDGSSVCSTTLTASQGLLTCNIPQSAGNKTLVALVYFDGAVASQDVFNLRLIDDTSFGQGRYILAFLALVSLVAMGISDKKLMLVFFIIGLVLISLFGLTNLESITGSASVLVFIVLSVVILMTKIKKEENKGNE